jgi:starch synthase
MVIEKAKQLKLRPNIIDCNDWQTGLIPVYLKSIYKQDEFFANTKTVFTIHNLAYQGLFPAENWGKTNLPKELFSIENLEYYGKINIMKGAIIFSDYITTVSPTYSKEIQTKEYGFGLDGVFRRKSDSIGGILNGIDYNIWNPETDPNVIKNYSKNTISKKLINKKYLQTESKMDIGKNIPLIGAVGRLTDQKGWDLIAEIIDQLCKMELEIVILGLGEKKYHQLMEEISKKYPHSTSINLKFDDKLARRIYAGCDFFLMPSKFEPCGLGQLISFRYGTVPIARQVGGLADTIIDCNEDSKNGTGFLFKDYNSQSLLDAIKGAIEFYNNKRKFKELLKRIMSLDFSWENSAKKYCSLYEELLKNHALINV